MQVNELTEFDEEGQTATHRRPTVAHSEPLAD